jgi:serine/threonine-protein kinase RsbW
VDFPGSRTKGFLPDMLMSKPQERLELDSRLEELSRVRSWVDAVADWHGVAANTRFAIQLCMEEALANVVLHGYGSEPGHPIAIGSFVSGDALLFTIEDSAPPFAPDQPGQPPDTIQPASLESMEPGGNGLRLLHHFAASVSYERLAQGNRLTVGFPLTVK